MKATWTILVCLVVIWAHGLEAREISRDNQKSHGSDPGSHKTSTTLLKSTTEPTPVTHVSSTGNPNPISTTPQRRRWFNLHRTLRSQRNTRVTNSNTTPNPKPTPSSTQKSQTSSLDKLAAIFGGHRGRTRNPQWNQRRVSTTTTESPSRSRSRSTRRTHTRRRTTTSTASPITGTSGPTGNQWVTLRTKRVHVKRIEKTAMAMDKDMLVQEALHLIDLLPTVQPAVKHAPHDRSSRPIGDVKSNVVDDDSGGASVAVDGSDDGSKSGDGDSSSSSDVDGGSDDSKRNHGGRSNRGSRDDDDDNSSNVSDSRDSDKGSDDSSSKSNDSSDDDDDDDDKEAPQPKTVYVTIIYRLRTGHTQITSDLLHALTTGQLMELIKRIQQEISKHQSNETTRRPRIQHRAGMELDKVCCPL